MPRMTEIATIGPLLPFVCSYRDDLERLMGVTLWGTDEHSIIRNTRYLARDLTVDGVLLATCPQCEVEEGHDNEVNRRKALRTARPAVRPGQPHER